jgi:hypothetical protein
MALPKTDPPALTRTGPPAHTTGRWSAKQANGFFFPGSRLGRGGSLGYRSG